MNISPTYKALQQNSDHLDLNHSPVENSNLLSQQISSLQGLMDFFKACPNIQELDLSSSGCELTDEAIRYLPYRVNTLNLMYCDKLTDEAIRHLPTGLTSLNLIDFFGNCIFNKN